MDQYLDEYRSSQWLEKWLLPIAVLAIPFSSIASVMLTQRDLNFVAFNIELVSVALDDRSVFVLQLLSALIVAASSWTLGARLFAKTRLYAEFSPILFWSLVAFYFFNFVFGFAVAESSGFVVNVLYSFLLFAAIVVLSPEAVPRLVSAIKLGISCVIALGVVLIPIDSNMVIQHGYAESWIQIPFRYFGLATHANSLGALALLLGLLEFMRPTRNRNTHNFVMFCAAFGLFLSQSKTAWFAAMVSIALLLLTQSGRIQVRPIPAVVLSVIAVLVSSLSWLLFFDSEFESVIASSVSEDAATLTGRIGIWQVALDAWLSNPFFGYGPTIWGEDFRMANGMPFAYHAHNQFLQALSAAGAVGAITFLVYFSAIAYRLVLSSTATSGVGLCILAMLVIRSFTEVPFAMNTVLSAELLTHASAFLLAVRTDALSAHR